MVDAAIYARTSGIESESARDQIGICKRRCQERGWTVRYILKDEGQSGGDQSRPGYNALWQHIEDGRIDVVVTWKIDRIARSLAEMTAIEEAARKFDVSLHSCTEPIDTTNSQGRFVFGILATAGQLERELGSDRVRSILSERARRGMWMHSKAPFGYCLGKQRSLRLHPSESPQVGEVFRIHSEEKSYSETATRMNVAGSLRRGKRWTAGTIQRVIENTMHVGHYTHWGQQVDKPKLRIVTDETWEAARQIRATSPRTGKRASYLTKQAAIGRVFDQYIAGLRHLDDESPAVTIH